jgi:hypothetical protein
MSTGILKKIVLISVGVLVLVQLLFYAAVRVENIDKSENERMRLAQEVENLSVTQSELQQYLGELQKEYKEMEASVPEQILQGYEDPEVLLASFLDYLKASELERVDAKVSMQGARGYVETPVPLFEHDLIITFSYTHSSDVRKLLSRILDQDNYPLTVRNFVLRNSGRKKISGTMQISLLIPARQEKPFSGTKEQGE